jgi:hypothetical protein
MGEFCLFRRFLQLSQHNGRSAKSLKTLCCAMNYLTIEWFKRNCQGAFQNRFRGVEMG